MEDSTGAPQSCEIEFLEQIGESSLSKAINSAELLLLADVTVAPSCDKERTRFCTCEACILPEIRVMKLQEMQLHFFMSRADDMLKNVNGGVSDVECHTASLRSLLFTCQPFFNFLESTARSTGNDTSPLIKLTSSHLPDLSETLANRLETLVLTFAKHGLLSLDETEPNSISYFHIGECEFGPVKVKIFRYCQPTPYLGQNDTGLYKRMRWNVDRTEDAMQQSQKDDAMEIDNTAYYFLCFEDIDAPDGDVVREWSIGQWIQVYPATDDLNDWVLCKIPQGWYLKQVIVGSEEPSCHIATSCLLQLLKLGHNSSQ